MSEATKLKYCLVASDAGTWGSDPDDTDTVIPVLRSTEIGLDGSVDTQAPALRSLTSAERVRTRLHKGDILVVRSSGSDLHLGKSGYVNTSAAGHSFSNFLQRLRFAPEHSPRFGWYFLNSLHAKQQIRKLSSTTTGLQNLSASLIAELEMPTPSPEEQRRIADFLDTETAHIDRLMKARRAQVTNLAERDYASISEALIPGSLLKGAGKGIFPWLPKLPEDRPLVRLGYVCRIQNGITVDGKRDVTGDVVTRPYLRVANVQAGHVSLDSVAEITVPRAAAERSTLRVGDVLMTEGGDLDKLGRGTVWNGELPNCLHQNHVFALRPDKTVLDGHYLALMTQTVHGRCYFESTGTKTTNLASTNSSKILNFPIPLPSLKIQRTLVSQVHEKLQTTAKIRSLLNRQLTLMAERRQALITAAVTGQFDVSTASGRGVDVT
ncbi:restriction endonuclease subunit S [Streptomyces verrucosisporus]|uniref:restriction endonuclease subunit S n=1 Tax=Streptomyces verrucosisporus TaxID=1695161 RepID=UPI0019D2BCB5|nr:restriction endonuclease subunit S [Streptomyces verrucosisporus]MBN3932552.1 restriction endonuclease subunit S [Streptomyces verrucosisporus]